MSTKLTLHGAARTVTGSCLEFHSGGSRLLVDCGMFQGSRTLEALNFEPLSFKPKQIDGVILTHAHIDHSGLLPRLAAEGYTGPIWCTAETADLLQFMLADSGRIHEYEAERRNRRRAQAGQDAVPPVYTEADAMAAWRLARPIPMEEWFEPAPGFRARLWNAGHILGAVSVELDTGGTHVLCSGDIGPENKAFEADPEAPEGFDHVICESTYGDRVRQHVTIEERRALLQTQVSEARERGGNLVIPAFALERTQELLLDLATLARSGRIGNAVIYVDSPLANQATTVFEKYLDQLEDTGGVNIFDHPAIHYVADATESMRLNSVSGAIIIAASGMCEGGRIRHHLIHNLHRRDSTVLFTGFQAEGTLGRVILEGAKRVRISGRDIMVRAQIRKIDSYSAHADQEELLGWIRQRGPIRGSLLLDHGEGGSIETLRRLTLDEGLAPSVIVPEIGETYELAPAKHAKRLTTGRTDIHQAIGRDWQNEYANLAANLKRELSEMRDAQTRQKAVEEMRQVLKRYADHREAKKRR